MTKNNEKFLKTVISLTHRQHWIPLRCCDVTTNDLDEFITHLNEKHGLTLLVDYAEPADRLRVILWRPKNGDDGS